MNATTIIRAKTATATLLGIIMAVTNLNPSWSQYAGTVNDYIFYPTLGLIYGLYLLCTFVHPEKDRYLFTIFKSINVDFKTMSFITAMLFLLVQAFSVNSPISWVALLHYIFTGLAITSATLILLFYPKSKNKRTLTIKMAIGGIIGFLLGVLFNVYSIGWGEVFVSLPQSLLIWFTVKSKI